MPKPDTPHAIDNIVVVLFENRSFDNVLGRLYGPEDGKNFDGVIDKDLSNPIPEWAENGADRKVVPYTGVGHVRPVASSDGQEHLGYEGFAATWDPHRVRCGTASDVSGASQRVAARRPSPPGSTCPIDSSGRSRSPATPRSGRRRSGSSAGTRR
jgi:hypothetical protein